MHISECVFKTFLEELSSLCKKTFEKLLQPVTFLKMLLIHRYFLTHFKIISKRFLIFFKVLPVRFNEQLFTIYVNTCFLHTKWRIQIFDPIVRGNAACRHHQWCQMMNYSHVEKDLNRKEYFNLNFENKTPH